ncbi:unnamed protein product [Allacma fusca]|uniref:Gustatory receptor n=1 Tax=Allacma fusca TaxID=39272 RepID=A0A8J2K2M4_9HEXA|nr:unnamed protein product [Allacma fusca]
MQFISGLFTRSRKEVQNLTPDSKSFPVINESTNGEILLKKTAYFGWIIGLFPVYPKSVEFFQSPTRHFFLYCTISILSLSVVMNLKCFTISHISQTQYNTISDKLKDYLAEFASLNSDVGIRLGFLLRSVECVLLFKGIQDYKREFSPVVGQKLSHKIMKYGSIFLLNFVYIMWIIGLGLRKLKFNQGYDDWGNITVTFSPVLESSRNIYIADILCHFSSIISSYYLILLVICISAILLDFLDDFHVKLRSDVQLQGSVEKCDDGFSRRGSNVTQKDFLLCPNEIANESNRNDLKLDVNTCLNEFKMKVNQRQFTCLTTLFRQFNQALGLSLVASVFADMMMIISIVYNLISSVLDTGEFLMLNIFNMSDDHYSSIFISASEAEYEARICIIAAIGSYVVHKMKNYKCDLEELFYSYEKPKNLVSNSPVRSLYERFKDWTWSLDGMDIFTINLRLLTSMLGTVVTYVIILLQVKMSEKSEKRFFDHSLNTIR